MRYGLEPGFDAELLEEKEEEEEIAQLQLRAYRYRMQRWSQAHHQASNHSDNDSQPLHSEMIPGDDQTPLASSSGDPPQAMPGGWEPLQPLDREPLGRAHFDSGAVEQRGLVPGRSFGPEGATEAARESIRQSRKRSRESGIEVKRRDSLGLDFEEPDSESEAVLVKRKRRRHSEKNVTRPPMLKRAAKMEGRVPAQNEEDDQQH